MTSHRQIPPLRELIEPELPAEEFERLARVDALLRKFPCFRVVEPSATRLEEERHELKFTYRELSLVYRSLQAAKTLGASSAEEDLLDDMITSVDRALRTALG
jgi:hypothetical protein